MEGKLQCLFLFITKRIIFILSLSPHFIFAFECFLLKKINELFCLGNLLILSYDFFMRILTKKIANFFVRMLYKSSDVQFYAFLRKNRSFVFLNKIKTEINLLILAQQNDVSMTSLTNQDTLL